jgi:hypothetical protein
LTEVSTIVGHVVADIAQSALASGTTGRRPAIRVTGFGTAEVVAIVGALEGTQIPGISGETVIKVGTRTSVPGLETHHLLGAGETLTYWRNADVPALVLVDLEPQGDEEGLAALNRLDDLSVLAGDDDADGVSRFDLVIRHAWRSTAQDRPLPGRLLECLATVRTAVAESRNLSLRRWTKYIAIVCSSLAEVDLLVPDSVHAAVGRNLPTIGLFPDSELFLDDRATRTRLTRNVRVSALRQPSGASISEDDLLHRVDTIDLSGELLTRFGETALLVRDRMRTTVEQGGPSESCAVELELWLALFERRAGQAGLGQLIREHIALNVPDRTQEFDDLEVEAGLDAGEQEAAEQLLRAEPSEGLIPLAELLSKGLRRRVEKLAFPDAQSAADPLRALLHALHVLAELEGNTISVAREGARGDGAWSVWLFALLYGPTLTDTSERSSEGARHLVVDSELTTVVEPPLPPDDEDFDIAAEWAPLRLTVTVGDGTPRRFRWEPLNQPGLVAFAGLLSSSDREFVGAMIADNLDAFCERFLDPRSWAEVQGASPRSDGPTSRALTQLRQRSLAVLRGGLSADALDDYVTEWDALITDARRNLVPHGSPMPELADVVLRDVIELGDGHLAMLALHPLRLRWVSRHLRHMSHYLVKTLAEGLELNAENSELFFEWLDRVSPQGTPPVLVGGDDYVAIATREFGWHEEYAPVRRDGAESSEWSTTVDDGAIEEMVSVIGSYIDTYPSKRDGLVIALLNRDGSARLPLRMMQRLRARWGRLAVELHVFAPRSSHCELVRAFEDAFTEESPGDRLFADVQLVVRPWESNTQPDLDDLVDRADVALAPALFGTRTTLNKLTRSAEAGLSGTYDPWIHTSMHDLADRSENVRRVMLPQQADPLLETWSTLSVRHDGQSPVAPNEPDNTDYFTLQVRFDRHQALFSTLHRVAHWVVTLDTLVGRDQIDNLTDRPDVILVRTGLGKNQAYTLLVSSSTGRRFVVQRLTRKLQFDLGFDDDPPVPEVAERFYEVGRHVVPGAVLRALGLGRATNEVVGLVASRFEVARRHPVSVANPALEVWISFDDHLPWFGRAQRIRADLGRFLFSVDAETGNVNLEILVVESKFRQVADLGAAEQQLDRTIELCRLAFGGGSSGSSDDALFWAQELAAAVQQIGRIDAPGSDLPARRMIGQGHPGLEDAVFQALRAGQVNLLGISGVAVGIAASHDAPATPTATLGAHELVQLNRPEFSRIVRDIVARVDPHTSPPAGVEAARPIAEDLAAVREGLFSAGLDGDLRSIPTTSAPVEETQSVDRGGLGDDALRGKYERLLDTLRQHSVVVDPPSQSAWQEGPGFYVLRVVPRPGVTVDRVVNRRDEIALALSLPRDAKIRTSLDRGAIAFEVPKESHERYIVSADSVWERAPITTDRLSVPLGEDIAGEVVSIDFSSPDSPHFLVAGTTGSGKSAALETVLTGLCRYSPAQVRLNLVDPKGTELQQFEGSEHLEGRIGMDAVDALEILEAAVAEMQRRYALLKDARARTLVEYNGLVAIDSRLPWKVILLDEYADLTSDPDDKVQLEQQLRRLTQKARAAGLHVIIATQRPSADVISTTIRSNFPAQLALRVKTATDSRIIMDETGAEALAGQGDAFLKTARGTTRLQIALVE